MGISFQQAVEYLSSLRPLGIRLGLERIQALCEACGHPEQAFRSIHVTGTNGKGSTCTMIAKILSCSGYRTGLFVSPFVVNVRERIQIDGRFISEHQFSELMAELIPIVEDIARRVDHPTEFEVKTILGLLYFARAGVDYAVLEVGMGGRFDSTNVVTPLATAITNVALDHTDRLGSTVEQIAYEKAGIIKPGIPCVTGADGGALKVIQRQCELLNAPLLRIGKEVLLEENPSGTFSVAVSRRYDNLTTAMMGRHQRLNAAIAVAIADLLAQHDSRITPQAVREGLATAVAPGRLEIVNSSPTVLLDGAHNPHGAQHLRQALTTLFNYRRLILVMGMLQGHSAPEVVGILAPLAHVFIATSPISHRSVSEGELAAAAEQLGVPVEVVSGVPKAVERALSLAEPEDLVCITGSFYTVGEARPLFVREPLPDKSLCQSQNKPTEPSKTIWE